MELQEEKLEQSLSPEAESTNSNEQASLAGEQVEVSPSVEEVASSSVDDVADTVSLSEETISEEVAESAPASEERAERIVYSSKSAVLERVSAIAHCEEEIRKEELDYLKTVFYRFHAAEREAEKKAFLDAGGNPEEYVVEPDMIEEEFKKEMGIIRARRAELHRAAEVERASNLKVKLDVIEELKGMLVSPEEVNRSFQRFRQLQQLWRDTGAVPPERSGELWRTYQHYVEQYYDLLKLNNEAREYDFKKNLELKTQLCETAERLDSEEDVISAFHQLQELHQQFRETGPVAKELREEIWLRFKTASTVINKKHQKHFEDLRAKEEENLAKKTALCERVEAIVDSPVTHSSQWEKLTKEIVDIQTEWKTIGFAPQKMNVKIFERFRSSCDTFFKNKTAFFKEMKKQYAENIAKKKALVEKAQALQDSDDWKSTSQELTALQKEWKSIGVVPKKVGDQLWSDFQAACNHFFDARNKATAGHRNEERANLERKRAIIEELKNLLDVDGDDVKERAEALIEEYHGIGHVPFKEKDKVYASFKSATDDLYEKHNVRVRRQRLEGFKHSLKEVALRGEDAVENERARLMRQYDSLRQEIQTYENNLCFLNISSKTGSSLLDEMNKKINRLKDNMNLVRDKIKAIDEAGKIPEETPTETAAETVTETAAETVTETAAETDNTIE